MKRNLLFLIIAAFALFGCKSARPEGNFSNVEHPEWVKDAVIYEVNIRQYTPEGTFAAFEQHLDRLQQLGVDVLWLMPIHPIGEEGRKGTLGSYYSATNYCEVNPEFGTIDDFRHLLEAAHQKGFKVILDWVANHTARDAKWTQEHNEWYYKDSLGNLAIQYDWTDIARLNYEHQDLREEMIAAMKYWVELGVDGFRCDVAAEVPTDFWNDAVARLKAINPDLFMLAEAEKAELQYDAFNAYYTWDQMHNWYALAEGKIDADSIANFYVNYQSRSGMPSNTIPMNFTTNHDQNSWYGTDTEMYGPAVKQYAVLSFVVPGMPMIYSGQEAGLDKRLEFFEKDLIDWERESDMADFYRDLIEMRDKHACLWAQPWGGVMVILPSDRPQEIFVFEREVEGDLCLAMFNFSDQTVTFNVDNHIVTRDSEFTLPPHGYHIIFSIGECFGDCDEVAEAEADAEEATETEAEEAPETEVETEVETEKTEK